MGCKKAIELVLLFAVMVILAFMVVIGVRGLSYATSFVGRAGGWVFSFVFGSLLAWTAIKFVRALFGDGDRDPED